MHVAGMRALAAVLAQCELTTLDLDNRDPRKKFSRVEPSLAITAEGARALALTLEASQLTTLNLGLNCIGDEGLALLASALPHSKLARLSLSSNDIRNAGVSALMHFLPHALSLTALDLSGNQVPFVRMACLRSDSALPALCS